MDWTKDTEHIRKAYLIPSTLQPKVCMCAEPGSPLFDYDKRVGPLVQCCKACRKPYRWNVRHCSSCKAWFIKDFRRKQFDCTQHTKCWDCIEALGTWKHIPPLGLVMLLICACDKEQSIRPDFGPLGLNPREVSQEEMDAAFDMPSVFD